MVCIRSGLKEGLVIRNQVNGFISISDSQRCNSLLWRACIARLNNLWFNRNKQIKRVNNDQKTTLTIFTMVSTVTWRTLAVVIGALIMTLSAILARLASTRVHIWKSVYLYHHLMEGIIELFVPEENYFCIFIPWSHSAPLQSCKHKQSFPTLQTPLSAKIVMLKNS